MVLTKAQIGAASIVVNGVQAGQRDTTYDATVGEILVDGNTVTEAEYRLPRRGVAWVVSAEEFHLPENVTGLATLRTTWTHEGVLALNVGVIDPGWEGPVATALVNFSDKEFVVKKGEGFFRILFLDHPTTGAAVKSMSRSEYLLKMRLQSTRTTSSFLNMKSLANEVTDEVLVTPRWLNRFSFWGLALGFLALILAIIGIFVPIAYGVSSDWAARKEQLETLKGEVERIKVEGEDLSRRLREVDARTQPQQRSPTRPQRPSN
jgi:dUTPase